MHCQRTQIQRHHPAPTAMQTQPLSKCMLLVCAYQITRQRNIGIAKKSRKAFDNYLAKEGCLEDPFFNANPQELSTLCIYPKQLLNKTKKVSINKTLSNISQLFPNMFDPAALKEHLINNNDLHRVALAQHLLYHSKGEMLRREQSKGHRKGTRAWQKNIQSL